MNVDQHDELEPGKGEPSSALFLDEVMGDLRLVIFLSE